MTQVIFDRINAHLQQRGLTLREGTVVEATLIANPAFTKIWEKARSGDAADIEAQTVVLRDEGQFRGRCRHRPGSHREGYRFERLGRVAGAGVAPGRGKPICTVMPVTSVRGSP